jgi:LPS-assembly lipoprotein
MKKLATNTLLICLIASIASCTGWRLRGSDPNTILMDNSVHLSGQQSATYSLIQKQLERKNAITSLSNAQHLLILSGEEWDRRSASVTRTAVTAEYELTLSINYEIRDAANNLVRPDGRVRIIRSYTFDQNDVAGKDKEEEIIRREIHRAAARQILQQLQLLQR